MKKNRLTSVYSRSLRNATDDLRLQSEFLFTSHVFKIRTCTQLHFHWIERGNVSRVTSFQTTSQATEKRLVETL